MLQATKYFRWSFCFVVCWSVCLTGYSSNELFAEDSRSSEEALKSKIDDDASASRPTKNITKFDINTIETLADVKDLIESNELDLAAEKLDELWSREEDFTASEKAEVKYMVAHVAHMQGSHELLVDSLENVLEFRENISYAREQEILLRLSKIYFSEKKYEKAHERLKAWFKISDQPSAQDLVYAGRLFAQVRDFSRAKQFLRQAITLQRDAGKEVDTKWSELLEFVESRLNASN